MEADSVRLSLTPLTLFKRCVLRGDGAYKDAESDLENKLHGIL